MFYCLHHRITALADTMSLTRPDHDVAQQCACRHPVVAAQALVELLSQRAVSAICAQRRIWLDAPRIFSLYDLYMAR